MEENSGERKGRRVGSVRLGLATFECSVMS